MTEKEIAKYINRLNQGKGAESIFTREISTNVIRAKVWSVQPKINDQIVGNFSSHNFFFIKDERGKYVGAVLDAYGDLQWYISPRHRKKGYLTNALKKAILPYIFENFRPEQRITITKNSIGDKNYESSLKVALNIGFQSINEEKSEFILKESDYDWEHEQLNEKNGKINKERDELLRKRVNYASKLLLKTSDELLMLFDNDKELSELVNEVKKYTSKIEDIIWEINK